MDWKNKVSSLCASKQIFSNLEKYVSLIIEYNKVMNLTGFSEDQIWKEGIYQSIVLLSKFIDKKQIKLLDIGAGAGFPSIPFLIFMDNQIDLTIMEPLKKRTMFLEIVKKELNLNVNIDCSRAEESKATEKFDFITARAVSELKNLIEISAQLGKINACYLFLKSKDFEYEIERSQWIIEQLKININSTIVDLEDDKKHVIIWYKKTNQTPPNLPRKWAQIIK